MPHHGAPHRRSTWRPALAALAIVVGSVVVPDVSIVASGSSWSRALVDDVLSTISPR